jgi:hypothetical protein
MDRRIWPILIVALLCIGATIFVYWKGYGHDPTTFFGAVLTAWIAGLALFLVTGILVLVISLARPEEDSFDARARILFRRQSGKHIDYIVERIKGMLEHYAERAIVKITINGFHDAERKYRVSSLNTVTVRSYLDDVETNWSSHIGRDGVTAPPAGGLPNRLVYLRTAGEPVGLSEEFQDAFTREISCRIDRNAPCEVNWLMEYWVRANDEPNTYAPQRYTQALVLHFENLTQLPVELTLTTDGTKPASVRLAPGVSKQVTEIKDIQPGTVAFNYEILSS